MAESYVCVSIVAFNSSRYLRRCLEAVLAQRDIDLEVVVVDNASTDGTGEILNSFKGRVRVIRNPTNAGFAAAQNQAIGASRAPWVMTLNPDVLLDTNFVRRLVDAGESDLAAGAVCGKLLSIGPGFQPLAERRLDSTGIFFTPEMRHFDRGWHEPDTGEYDRSEYVFGACAAAALYRRAMIGDVSIRGQFFDPDFFAYREDADVAWRAQLLGWRCIYAPDATAWHVRTMIPGDRSSVAPVINMHSVKNRFLMRIKNATAGVYRDCWFSMTVRDLLVIGACLTVEPRSLPAFWRMAHCWRAAWDARREIMRRRRVDDSALVRWFRFAPASEPREAEEAAAAAAAFAPDAA
jgi:GT2 family glycosyltransferase